MGPCDHRSPRISCRYRKLRRMLFPATVRTGMVINVFLLLVSLLTSSSTIITQQEEALLVVDEFTANTRELQEGPGMPSDDVDYMAAKVTTCMTGPLQTYSSDHVYDTRTRVFSARMIERRKVNCSLKMALHSYPDRSSRHFASASPGVLSHIVRQVSNSAVVAVGRARRFERQFCSGISRHYIVSAGTNYHTVRQGHSSSGVPCLLLPVLQPRIAAAGDGSTNCG